MLLPNVHIIELVSDNKSAIRTAQILICAGAIPFFVGAIWLLMASPSLRPHISQALTHYAAVIISFLGGIQWGIGVATIDAQPKTARSLFMLSVVPSLLAWLMLFMPVSTARIIVALVLIGFVWIIDTLLHVQKVIPTWFFRLRSIISAIVLTSLALTLLVN